jgi:hypothetical protein
VAASVGFDLPQRRGQVTDQAVPEPARIIVRDLAAAAAGVAVHEYAVIAITPAMVVGWIFLSSFMPSALKDEFTKALDILVGAQSEQQIDHQHRQSGIGWKKDPTCLKMARLCLQRWAWPPTEDYFGRNRTSNGAARMICSRRWVGRAHEFGQIDGRWPFHVTNNRERKREQDEKLDHRCSGYSPPTDAAVVLMLAIE